MANPRQIIVGKSAGVPIGRPTPGALIGAQIAIISEPLVGRVTTGPILEPPSPAEKHRSPVAKRHPSSFWIPPDCYVQIDGVAFTAGTVLTLRLLVEGEDGLLQVTQLPLTCTNVAQVPDMAIVDIQTGYVVAVSVSTSGVGAMGYDYARVSVYSRTTKPAGSIACLYAGYVTKLAVWGSPGYQALPASLDLPFVTLTTHANPAPGNSIILSIPQYEIFDIKGIQCILSTSAAVPARTVYLTVGGVYMAASTTPLAAASIAVYNFVPNGVPQYTAFGVQFVPTPILEQNSVSGITISAVNLDATDQFTDIRIVGRQRYGSL